MTLFRLTDNVVHFVWFTWLDEDEGVGFFVGHFTGLDPFFLQRSSGTLSAAGSTPAGLLISEVSCVLLRGFVHACVGPFCASIIKASLEPACLFYVPQLYHTLKCSFNKSVVLCVCVSDYRFRVSVFPAFFVSHFASVVLPLHHQTTGDFQSTRKPNQLCSGNHMHTHTGTGKTRNKLQMRAVGWLLHPPGTVSADPGYLIFIFNVL